MSKLQTTCGLLCRADRELQDLREELDDRVDALSVEVRAAEQEFQVSFGQTRKFAVP